MTDDYLEEKRRDIAETDKQIIALMKRRLDLATDIGKYKSENGLDVRNPDVERRVIDRYRYLAAESGLDPDRCERICRLIMQESREKEGEVREGPPKPEEDVPDERIDPARISKTRRELLAVGIVSMVVVVAMTAVAAILTSEAGNVLYMMALPLAMIALCYYLGDKDVRDAEDEGWIRYVRRRTYIFGMVFLALSVAVLAVICMSA